MKSPSRHSPEVRAAALAALLAGQSVSQVAKEYKLPKGTVSSWRKRKAEGVAPRATVARKGATQKQTAATQPPAEDVGDLLMTLLRKNLEGLIAAAEIMRDPAWLKSQGAAELGTFLGITHDKVVRMLEAMDRQDPAVPESPPSAP